MHAFWIIAGLLAAQTADRVDDLLALSDKVHADLGYKQTGWVQKGSLAAGEKLRLSVELKGGATYELRGACDDGCDDLDLELSDAAGRVIASDTQTDDAPLVDTDRSGSYFVLVTMNACKTEKCVFGVKAYSK
jgi:hypothetical protein